VHNNDFESFIFKKTSMEDIEDSNGWNAQNMSTDWVCSTECGLSVYSHLLVLTYAIYAKSGYNMYRGWTQTDYQNEHYNINQKTKEHWTTEEEMEGPTSS